MDLNSTASISLPKQLDPQDPLAAIRTLDPDDYISDRPRQPMLFNIAESPSTAGEQADWIGNSESTVADYDWWPTEATIPRGTAALNRTGHASSTMQRGCSLR